MNFKQCGEMYTLKKGNSLVDDTEYTRYSFTASININYIYILKYLHSQCSSSQNLNGLINSNRKAKLILIQKHYILGIEKIFLSKRIMLCDTWF